MPGDELPTAATLSATPIACSALTACGLTLTAAPISPKAGAVSKTSTFIPNAFSALAAASPASPPPTIAILKFDDIFVLQTSINRDPCCLYDSSPATLLLCQVRSKFIRSGRPRAGAHLCKGLFDFIGGERTGDRFAELLPDGNRSARRRNDKIDRYGD